MYGFNRAAMLNHRASASQYKPDEVIPSLNIKRNNVIADIGSGGGYYTIRFAAETGLDGIVYAVDMNQKFLDYIDNQSKKSGLINIRTILIEEDEVKELPKGGCDLIFLRNVYHHLQDPRKYFEKIKYFLKQDGRIAIIDYKKKNGFSFISLFRHYVEEEDIITCLKKCGYKHVESFKFLPEQSFNIFKNMISL